MTHDVLIAGGGLAGSLAALRLVTDHPHLKLCVLEAGDTLGGNHTWSFHDDDVSAASRRWLEPLVVQRWSQHDVKFPRHARRLSGGYSSITSCRLHDVISPILGGRLRLDAAVASLTQTEVTLRSGETMHARIVIDARGATEVPGQCGWQTFFGQELVLAWDHRVPAPMLMDATVRQDGGFRFIYLLPWSPRRVLVEDTLYADHPGIDVDDRRSRIARYVGERGWVVQQVIREERGALPIPLDGDGAAFWTDNTIRIGVRAGLFHPTTGYSLPDAVAVAEMLATLITAPADQVHEAVKQFALRRWSQRGFFRMLNRLLFLAAEPQSRIHVLDQFYRRPEPLIARFYADRLTWIDRCRLLAGRPPVPVSKALTHLRARAS